MSRTEAMMCVSPLILIGLKLISTGNSLLSFRRAYKSNPLPIGRVPGASWKAARCSACLLRTSLGSKSSIGRSNNSSRGYPKSDSVCELICWIFPFGSTITIASGAVSIIPRKRASLCPIFWNNRAFARAIAVWFAKTVTAVTSVSNRFSPMTTNTPIDFS